MMDLNKGIDQIRKEIRKDLERTIDGLIESHDSICRQIICYHFGWDQTGVMTGKMIRPIFLIKTCEALGGARKNCLPQATAIELIHNFSLIHDDIEDDDQFRHGRPTAWKEFGIAQAINAGDAMIAAAFYRLSDQAVSKDASSLYQRYLSKTLLDLTKGQARDIELQKTKMINSDAYWEVVDLKTGSLIAESFRFGALAAGLDWKIAHSLHEFGMLIGRAFQVRDDILGIWGSVEKTGKPNTSDILHGKKTLPVILGSEMSCQFKQKIQKENITEKELEQLMSILEDHNIMTKTEIMYQEIMRQAAVKLEELKPSLSSMGSLMETVQFFFERQE